jgi:hypothetical protein
LGAALFVIDQARAMPAIVTAAFVNELKPVIDAHLRFIAR